MSEDDWIQEDWKEDDWEHHEPVKAEELVNAEEPVNAGEPVEVEEPKPQPKIEEQKPAVEKVVEPSHVKPAQPSMNDEILQGVDNGFDSFGKNVKEIFYKEMESSKQLKRGEILGNMEQFHAMIEQFFGVGSPLVERCVGREILRIFNLPSESWVEFQNSCRVSSRDIRKSNLWLEVPSELSTWQARAWLLLCSPLTVFTGVIFRMGASPSFHGLLR